MLTTITNQTPTYKLIASIIFAMIITPLTYIVAAWQGWVDMNSVPWLELFAVFTSYSCTFLCVVQSRWNYPIGIASTLAYILIFFTATPNPLYASAVLNIYLVGTLVYGWFRWGQDDVTRPVTSILNDSWVWWAGYGFIVLAALGIVYNTNILLGGQMAAMDTTILVLSVLAQFLLDNKKIETWIVWLVVNVIAIYVYWKAGLTLIVFQYIFFLMNTALGYYSWKVNPFTKIETDGIVR